MTASIREQICAGMESALLDASIAGGNIDRSYNKLITRAQSPMVVVTPEDEVTQIQSDDADRNDLLVQVQITVRSNDPFDTSADAIAVPAHAALMQWALTCPLFSSFRRVHSAWFAEEADLTAGVLTMKYLIVYLSNPADISSPPLG